ncbi:hypothetical protein KGF57_003465 [Candida theae]|uniref:Extradiol ring-cleavage dioxygenase class III enzyme subunit B domain-containing protein n=1 Tax=Candida theae TaxID=1198502 RepID=A0AAD5BDF1_9ASCO|nr:uncharacterized protein KGF57_003465 [Candida theae]KAI5955980.1 hypothetical protein KGF57_003465 [Candida theae]
MQFWLVSVATVLPSLFIYYYCFNTSFTQQEQKLTVTEMSSISKYLKHQGPVLPSYFFSHGGPTFMYENDSFGNKGAWNKIKSIGHQIKTLPQQDKPDYIIVVSAHWQSSASNKIEISTTRTNNGNGENPLIYDFYGFPKHMYAEEFHSNSNAAVANAIMSKLADSGFKTELTDRGIDHGVWVPFKVAFSGYNTLSDRQPDFHEKRESDLPDIAVIQVSLTSNDTDFNTHFKLGQILDFFRHNDIWDEAHKKYLKGMVVCSGMSVHNLRDLGVSMQYRQQNPTAKALPYVKPFNDLMKSIVESDESKTSDTLTRLNDLKKDPLLRKAHPTLEHFLPLVVACGIANDAKQNIKEIYNDELGSLGWGIYQVGENIEPKM